MKSALVQLEQNYPTSSKKRRLVVEVESLASSWRKLRRVDVKALASSSKKMKKVDELSTKIRVI